MPISSGTERDRAGGARPSFGALIPSAAALVVLGAALFAQDAPAPIALAPPDTARARAEAGAAKLYDTTVLLRIEIVISDDDVNSIVNRTTDRVRCVVTIDGLTLKDVGVRQAGGVYHPYVTISNKPSLSLKFDEFAKAQRLFGLDKLVLKNELQDNTLVNEHLAYEVFRRAGLAAPLTAHARVTINGIDDGIYLMREPIDKEFLRRNFGGPFDGGNLFEIENTREFVFEPGYPKLDDEGKSGRTRTDLLELAAAIIAATPESFEREVGRHVDIARLITYVSAEIATGHWDGLAFRNNNTYIYHLPGDGRFVFIPYGADQALRASPFGSFGPPRSYLVQQLVRVPSLARRLNEETARIASEPVWNQKVLLERVDQLARIFAAAEGAGGRTAADIMRFASNRAWIENLIRGGGAR